MANRYWVASFAGTWNDTFNWSTTSGGFGGASVPGASDTAIFDGNGIGKCTLDMNVTVDYLDLTSGYTGAGADDGHFDCDGFDVTITSSSHVAFSNKTVTFDDGTATTWTFGQGFNSRGSSASFASMTACTWRFTGTGTVDSPSSKASLHKILIENGANIRSDWGFYSRNFELRGRLRVSLNYPGVYIDGAGTSEIRITSTGVLECRTVHGGGFSCQSGNANSVLNLYVDGSFDDPGNNERFRNNSGFQIQAGTTNIYATVPIDCTYQMRTGDNVNGNVHKLQQNTTFNRLRVDHHWSRTITFDQNNYDVTFGGEVAFYEAGKPTAWIPGTGSVILAPSGSADINFDGKTIGPLLFSDTAAGTATLQANVTTPYVHDCANQIDENGYTVTTTGTDPSPCSTGSRYWVGLVDSDYENSGNWSTSSGGLGNASVPVGSNDVVFDSGSSVNCTMSASRAAASINAQSGYGGAIDFAANNMRCLGNFTLDHGGGMDFGSGTHYMGGFFDVKDCGTLDYATSSVELAGTGTNMMTWSDTDTNKSFYDVIVSGNLTTQNVPYSAVRATNSYTISGTLTHNATSGARMTTANACPMVVSGTLTGVGTCAVSTTASGAASLTISGSGSVTISKLAMGLGGVTGSYVELGAGDYSGCDVEMSTSNSSSDAPLRFSGNVTLKSLNFTTSSGANMVVQNSTHNPSITLKGDLTCTTSNVVWSAGDGTIILDNSGSQSVNFNGQTVEGIHVTDASTGSIVLASDFSTAWLRDCNDLIDLNGYTITNADTEDRCAYPYDPPTTIALDSTKAITTDLQAWWPLVDGSGATATEIISSNNGSLDSTVFFNPSILGYNAEFDPDGVNDGITTTYSPNGLSAISLSAWVRNDGGSAGDSFAKILASDHAAASGGFDWMIRKSTNASYSLYIANTGTLSTASTSLPSVGEWWHAAATWETGGNIKLYINGAEVTYSTQGSYTGSLTTTNDVEIGDAPDRVRPWNGGIQNVRVWSRALSSSEVSSLYSDPWIGSDYTAVVPPSNRFFSPAAFARLG